MILDFNNENLEFNVENLLKYKIKTIDANIKKYNQFLHDKAVDATFEKVFNSEVFLMTLLDEESNNIHDLSITYNSIAQIMGEPMITDKQLEKILRLKGYEVTRSTQHCNGKRTNIKKVTKIKRDNLPLW